MKGITIDELYDFLRNNHEIEFQYQNKIYVLQPEIHENISYLIIFDCTPYTGDYLVQKEIPANSKIPKSVIDSVLLEKCFSGMSFLEIEKDITVTDIF